MVWASGTPSCFPVKTAPSSHPFPLHYFLFTLFNLRRLFRLTARRRVLSRTADKPKYPQTLHETFSRRASNSLHKHVLVASGHDRMPTTVLAAKGRSCCPLSSAPSPATAAAAGATLPALVAPRRRRPISCAATCRNQHGGDLWRRCGGHHTHASTDRLGWGWPDVRRVALVGPPGASTPPSPVAAGG